jgi:hypothetical protein
MAVTSGILPQIACNLFEELSRGSARNQSSQERIVGLIFLIVPAVVALFGIVLALGGLQHLTRGRVGKGGAHVAVGSTIGAVGLAVGLLALNTQLFARLTYESQVADVSVKAVDPAHKEYLVTIKRLDIPDLVQTCTLQGDEWIIEGRVQKWQPWANAVGLDSTYVLEQISNKYFDAMEANGKPITACDLTGKKPDINQYIPPGWLAWLAHHSYTEDRRFGSANYMPLADGAVYRMVMTQSGLNAQPENPAAEKANASRPNGL